MGKTVLPEELTVRFARRSGRSRLYFSRKKMRGDGTSIPILGKYSEGWARRENHDRKGLVCRARSD